MIALILFAALWVLAGALWATGDIKPVYAASSNLTVTNLASIASSSTWLGGWESGVIDNTTNLYRDYRLTGEITVNATSVTANTEIRVYVFGIVDDTPTYPDVFDGTESTETVTSAGVASGFLKLGAVIQVDATTGGRVYPFDVGSVAALFNYAMPKKFGIFITHNTGSALAASGQQVTITGEYQNVA